MGDISIPAPSEFPQGAVRLGVVAHHFQISTELLRLYEREKILIPLRTANGWRYFTEQDYNWIGMILKLTRRARLSFESIRRLASIAQSNELRPSVQAAKANCPIIKDPTQPCWATAGESPRGLDGCYSCAVYRATPTAENLLALLGAKGRTEYTCSRNTSDGESEHQPLCSFCPLLSAQDQKVAIHERRSLRQACHRARQPAR